MRKLLIASSTLVALCGCVAPPPEPEPAVVVTQPTPVCANSRQCEAMWAEASQAIEVATGMRVRIQSDSMIDTFAPMHRGYLHGRVLKRPVSSGGYEIVANMDCGSYGYGCRNDINNAINLFNINVNQAGQPFVNKK